MLFNDTTLARFWNKVNKNGPIPDYSPNLGPCWIWMAAHDGNGYGQFSLWPLPNIRAHRFSYQVIVGPVPDGLQLDHMCRVHRCVNPSHLHPVTKRDNVLLGQGVSAQNARKTHCVNGHPFDSSNTAYIKEGNWTRRRCITCRRKHGREATRRYRQK